MSLLCTPYRRLQEVLSPVPLLVAFRGMAHDILPSLSAADTVTTTPSHPLASMKAFMGKWNVVLFTVVWTTLIDRHVGSRNDDCLWSPTTVSLFRAIVPPTRLYLLLGNLLALTTLTSPCLVTAMRSLKIVTRLLRLLQAV